MLSRDLNPAGDGSVNIRPRIYIVEEMLHTNNLGLLQHHFIADVALSANLSKIKKMASGALKGRCTVVFGSFFSQHYFSCVSNNYQTRNVQASIRH